LRADLDFWGTSVEHGDFFWTKIGSLGFNQHVPASFRVYPALHKLRDDHRMSVVHVRDW
jgi:hypothetical protein